VHLPVMLSVYVRVRRGTVGNVGWFRWAQHGTDGEWGSVLLG